jgi:hypothetical protein
MWLVVKIFKLLPITDMLIINLQIICFLKKIKKNICKKNIFFKKN